MTGTKGSGFSAFITSPRQTSSRVSFGCLGSLLTLMVREAWTMSGSLICSGRFSKARNAERLEFDADSLPEQTTLVKGIEAGNFVAVAAAGAIVDDVAHHGEQAAADFQPIDLDDRRGFAGWRADEGALGNNFAVDPPLGSFLPAAYVIVLRFP